jgi:transposase
MPPMWTSENRARYDRDELRYPSEVTDAEWALIEPLIPAAKRGGRGRKTGMRQSFNAFMYLLSAGWQWRHLPKGFSPANHGAPLLRRLELARGVGAYHDALYEFCRAQMGARPAPPPRSSTVKREERQKRMV